MKIFCIGRNYAAHARELGNEVPEDPVIFMKPESALLAPGRPFFYPGFTRELHYECELVIRISKNGRNISQEHADDYYDAITAGIDFTARDVQSELKAKGLPWEKAKAWDNSALVGEWVSLPEIRNKSDIHFGLYRNKELVQDGHSANMIHSFGKIISHISRYFSVNTGDLIFTGTPAGVAETVPGDTLEGFLEGTSLFRLEIEAKAD